MAEKIIDVNKLSKRISDRLLEFSEVSRLAEKGFTESITNTVLGREQVDDGVKLTLEDDKLTVSLNIYVYYGINIPQLSYDIQSVIKTLIENISDYKIRAVNINVEGVDQNKEQHG